MCVILSTTTLLVLLTWNWQYGQEIGQYSWHPNLPIHSLHPFMAFIMTKTNPFLGELNTCISLALHSLTSSPVTDFGRTRVLWRGAEWLDRRKPALNVHWLFAVSGRGRDWELFEHVNHPIRNAMRLVPTRATCNESDLMVIKAFPFLPKKKEKKIPTLKMEWTWINRQPP